MNFYKSLVGRSAWSGARAYHHTFGMRGGYVNGALNWLNQSYTQGGNISNYFSLEGKSITGLIMASGLTYGTSLRGQLVIGGADPWANVTYKSKTGLYYNGFITGNENITKTTALSIMGMFGAFHQLAPISKFGEVNFMIEQTLLAPAQNAVTNQK